VGKFFQRIPRYLELYLQKGYAPGFHHYKPMPEFYPDIHEYLEGVQNKKSVSAKDLDEMTLRVRAHTGLPREICSEIVKHCFQEMRNAMLRGERVTLRGLGKLYIASPRTGSRKKIFPKFEPFDRLLSKVNERP